MPDVVIHVTVEAIIRREQGNLQQQCNGERIYSEDSVNEGRTEISNMLRALRLPRPVRRRLNDIDLDWLESERRRSAVNEQVMERVREAGLRR